MILTQLVAKYGWPELARRIELRCFSDHPSISSSLKVLRRNPWARGKLERMYVEKMVKRVRASERGSG
jgi:uncharacterized protein (DUF2132 family)